MSWASFNDFCWKYLEVSRDKNSFGRIWVSVPLMFFLFFQIWLKCFKYWSKIVKRVSVCHFIKGQFLKCPFIELLAWPVTSIFGTHLNWFKKFEFDNNIKMTGQWVAFFDVLGHSKNKNVKLLKDPWIKYHYDLAVKIFIIKD